MSFVHPVPRRWLAREDATPPLAPPAAHVKAKVGPRPSGPKPPKPSKNCAHPRAAWALAIFIVAATVACIAVQPMPDGAEPDMAWWQEAVEIAMLLTIVGAVIALWHTEFVGPYLGVAAGLAMGVETVLCPSANHHQLGWFVWVQAVLSGLVLLAALAYLAVERRAGIRLRVPPTGRRRKR